MKWRLLHRLWRVKLERGEKAYLWQTCTYKAAYFEFQCIIRYHEANKICSCVNILQVAYICFEISPLRNKCMPLHCFQGGKGGYSVHLPCKHQNPDPIRKTQNELKGEIPSWGHCGWHEVQNVWKSYLKLNHYHQTKQRKKQFEMDIFKTPLWNESSYLIFFS